MSFRSGSNTNFTFNNLKVNGTLTLEKELEIPNLEVDGDTLLNHLDVSGDTSLNDLTVNGDTQLNTLSVVGGTNFIGPASATVLQVTSNLTTTGELDVNGNVKANNTIITPAQLSYVSGVTSNIQTQLNGKAGTANPTFTGVTTTATSESTGFAYFGNDGSALPTFNSSNRYGGIGANMTGGHGEMDFINDATDTTLSAFDWYMMTSASAHSLLMRLYHSGELWISGLLNAVGGITTSTLTATGHSQLADVNATNVVVNGNLNVAGLITSPNPSNMEVVQVKIGGPNSSMTGTSTLSYNTTGTTNYVVMPSYYYSYTGSSGGTYSAMDESGSMKSVIISKRTSSTFVWSVQMSDNQSANIWIVFLVVYNVAGITYPVSSTS